MITNLRFIFKKTTTIQKLENQFKRGEDFSLRFQDRFDYDFFIRGYYMPQRVALVGSLNNGKTTLYNKLSKLHVKRYKFVDPIGKFGVGLRTERLFYSSDKEMVRPFLEKNPSAIINKDASEEDLLALKLFSIEYCSNIMRHNPNYALTDRCFIDLIAFQTMGKGKKGIREFIKQNEEFLTKTLKFYTYIYFFINQFPIQGKSSNNPNRTKDKKWAKEVHKHFLTVLKVMEEFSFIREHEHKFIYVK